jgi:FkbM family methyltransferase
MDWQRLSRLGQLAPPSVRALAGDQLAFGASAPAYRAAYRRLDGQPVTLRARALKHPFEVRAAYDDLNVLREIVTYRDVMPPADFTPTSILDVGANIGAAIALLATEYPDAAIVGVEADEGNARLCERNIKPYAARVVHAAAWSQDGTVTLGGRSPSRLHVGGGDTEVQAMSMNRLVADTRPDFIVMDIEGGEQHLLAHETDWASDVQCVSDEVHETYTSDECIRDLRRLGFDATLKPAPRDPRVVGRRSAAAARHA